MDIYFYTYFGKKQNSTKIPVVENNSPVVRYTVTGHLKEPCSILHPIVEFQNNLSSTLPFKATYAYIPEFTRYYFVKDWSWMGGLWVVHMDVDVLATYKTVIGGQTEYVVRSATVSNDDIMDMTYISTTNFSTVVTENPNAFTPDSVSSGCYIIGVISKEDDHAVGAINYYLMNSTEFGNLKETLLSDANLEAMGILSGGVMQIQDVSQQLLKVLYNPFQYIASCMWFPINASDVINKSPVNTIPIGWWNYNLGAYVLTSTTIIKSEQDINISVHPQSSTRGSYLNYAPYTRRSLSGRYGTIPLDGCFFKAGDAIRISYKIDIINGECRTIIYRIRNNAIDFVTERNFLLGVPIQIAQIGTDRLGTAVTAFNTVTSALSQGVRLVDPFRAAGTVVTGLYNTLQAQMPQLETSGSNGTFLSASNNTKLISIFYQIVDEDLAHRGRPLCELKQLNTLRGFILCAEGDMDIDCYDEERTMITNFLTTGFFME